MDRKSEPGTSYANLGSSSSVETDELGGSNEFILTNRHDKQSIPYWKRKCHQAFSKKTLFRKLPILNWLPKYDKASAVSDLIAGITIGLTVIPQSLAYSSIAGTPIQYGLYTAFMGCFVYIVFGGCKDVAMGPSAIVAILIAEAVKGKGPEHATLLCFLTGIIQLLMGFFGLGFLIDFISGPVSSGFISAAAITIVTSQIKHMLGIQASESSFLSTWTDIIKNIHKTSLPDAIVGFTCLVVLLILRIIGSLKIQPVQETPLTLFQIIFNKTLWFVGVARNAILVIISSIISYYYSEDGGVPFKVTGYVPPGLPTPQLPPFSHTEIKNDTVLNEDFFDMIQDLSSGLIIVPLIALLEDIAVCKAFADGKHVDATQEFIAIGLCNITNSFFQGFPGTGSISRSAVNHSSGVKTTLGGLYTGILVITSLLFLTPYFYYIPKPTLAAIIIAAAVFMVEVKILRPMWKAKKSDLIPGFATLFGCLFLPFQYGILIGVGINFTFIMYHAARPKITMERLTSREGVNYLLVTPDRCLIFPSVNYVRNLVTKYSVKEGTPVVIDCSHIYGADYTAATVIETLTEDFSGRGQPLFFFNLKSSVSTIIDGLSPKEFVVYYNRDEFDETLRRWCERRGKERY